LFYLIFCLSFHIDNDCKKVSGRCFLYLDYVSFVWKIFRRLLRRFAKSVTVFHILTIYIFGTRTR
jgi:hypothetical protein